MLSGWSIILISLVYVGLLFAIAYYGDKTQRGKTYASNPYIYALSLAVYCSSWTFYGAVGRATYSGWEFMATYLGPILVYLFGWRMIEKIILISKQQNITSISDFISSRYGKSQSLAVCHHHRRAGHNSLYRHAAKSRCHELRCAGTRCNRSP